MTSREPILAAMRRQPVGHVPCAPLINYQPEDQRWGKRWQFPFGPADRETLDYLIGELGVDQIVQTGLGGPAQWTRYGDAPHYDDTNCNVWQRNIVCWDEGRLWVELKWLNYRMILDPDLYYDYSGAPVSFPGLSLEEWRRQGRRLDLQSIIADPLFEAPAQGNFRLKEDSPALKLGFVPFDLATAGPRQRQR